MANRNKTFFVTGASTGVGRCLTKILANKGHRVFAGARKEKDLEELNKINGVNAVKLDITLQKDVNNALKFIENETTKLDGLINNAGIGAMGPIIDTTIDEIENLFKVNVYGTHCVTQAFFPLLKKAKGRIIMVTSTSDSVVTPFTTAYSMTKFAEKAYCHGLRRELEPLGIKVSMVAPSSIKTAIWDKLEKNDLSKYDSSHFKDIFKLIYNAFMTRGKTKGLEPEKVVNIILKALTAENPKIRYLVAIDTKRGENREADSSENLDKEFKTWIKNLIS